MLDVLKNYFKLKFIELPTHSISIQVNHNSSVNRYWTFKILLLYFFNASIYNVLNFFSILNLKHEYYNTVWRS